VPIVVSHEPPAGRPAALVTGGAVRLGRAIALALAGAGYDIALHYGRSAEAAAETAAAIRALGASCHPLQLDLADAAALPGLVSQARTALPGLRVLVNSASAYTQATIGATTAEIFDQQLAVNLRAPFFLTQAFAQQVGQGHVINVIDNKVAFNQHQYAAYLLAKKSLAELTRMAAVEFAPGVQVNAVAPGVVLPAGTRSPEYIAWRVSGIPLRRQGTTDDITGAILYLLGSPFVTGQILTVDGGEALTNVGQNAAQFDPSKI
jgi:NAD(P)-dependent dehydrogenase (short-subunit alcohol dehydrogenase family)